MADVFMASGRTVNDVDALGGAADAIRELGEKALTVTNRMMRKLGNLGRLTNVLEASGIRYTMEDGVNGEPGDGVILHGLSVYQKENCNFLIALGGGSPTGSMKTIAILAARGGKPVDYMGKTVTRKLCPMAVMPTAAGTGSKATQSTIITDRATQMKMLLKGPSLMPDLAVVDLAFTVMAPKGVTAATNVGALTHTIETYTSRRAWPLSGTFALSACQRIFASLRKVWENGQDREGWIQMSLAALEAGMAFNNASVTVIHGMSHPIGAMFHVPHGISNAVLLNVCLGYILGGVVERFAGLARACGLADAGDSDGEATQTFVDMMRQLLKEIEIPTPAEYGIAREEFLATVPKMARDAAVSGGPASTRREITVKAMEELYEKFWWERNEEES